jgi:hypothetical protein
MSVHSSSQQEQAEPVKKQLEHINQELEIQATKNMEIIKQSVEEFDNVET